MEEIINKVAQSGLTEINLEDWYDSTEKIGIDIKDFLNEINIGESKAYMLREKFFREKLGSINLDVYKGKLVYVYCSAEAIIPTWAYMLISLTISPVAKKMIVGTLEQLEEILFYEAIDKANPENYRDAKVVIRGCSKVRVPLSAYSELAAKLKPYVKSIMYGEPCSTVPLYKTPKG
jgi:hypothetical protein